MSPPKKTPTHKKDPVLQFLSKIATQKAFSFTSSLSLYLKLYMSNSVGVHTVFQRHEPDLYEANCKVYASEDTG